MQRLVTRGLRVTHTDLILPLGIPSLALPNIHGPRVPRALVHSAKTAESTPARQAPFTSRTREKRSMYHKLAPQGHAQIVA